MLNNNYKIANINFKSDYNLGSITEKFLSVDEYQIINNLFVVHEIEKQKVMEDMLLFETGNISRILMYEDIYIMCDHKWRDVYFKLDNLEKEKTAIDIIFYTHAVQRHMIQLHSSLIATTDNRGLMFLGPSGIGKTTQAELWHKYRDALIINGDIVFVQETEDAFLGWGTPWHGSSPYCENTNVPVEALIVLKQAPENSIRELTGFEKVSEVSNSVFYPRWLENGMELCLETLDHLLSKLPVYELRCRPDEDAVRLTEETIFKN